MSEDAEYLLFSICGGCGFSCCGNTESIVGFFVNDHDCNWWDKLKFKLFKIRRYSP